MEYLVCKNKINKLIKSKQYDRALDLVKEALNSANTNIKELINLKASILLKQKEYTQVVELYKNTIMLNYNAKEDKASFSNLSYAYYELGEKLYGDISKFQSEVLDLSKNEAEKYVYGIEDEIIKICQSILDGSEDPMNYYNLAYQHMKQLQMVEACIYYRLYEKYNNNLDKTKDEVYNVICTYNYLIRFYEQLKNEDNIYCLISNVNDQNSLDKEDILINALSQLGKEVYVIMKPIICEVESVDFDIENILEITIENRETYGNIHRVYPVELIKEGIKILNSLEDTLYYLQELYCKEACWIVIGDKEEVSIMGENIKLYKQMQKLYIQDNAFNWDTLSAYFIGNYLYIAERMYGFDIPTQMKEEPKVKISIVLPVKSYTYTLEDTLKTCLNQNFDEYEIVVSDNSVMGDPQICRLIEKFNSNKIKYYKTPYPLSLAKSFEYAYFRARGEFIFSLGADDAVLPYTLKYISCILDKFPEENILTWDRLLYIWPELTATGQADQFSFPLEVVKDKLEVSYIDTDKSILDTISSINQKISNIYHLPMIYINSGMRKEHIKEMIKLTGKFLDGSSQDVYTGLVNMAIYRRILKINYPLTIAGMSNSSIGLSSVVNGVGLSQYKNLTFEFNNHIKFLNIPDTKSQKTIYPVYDYILFIYELLRVCDLKIDNRGDNWKDKIDFEAIFEWYIISRYNQHPGTIDSSIFIKKCAKEFDEKFNIKMEALIKKHKKIKLTNKISDNQDITKRYRKGIDGNRWLTLDGSEFSIKKISEANSFFVKLLSLM